LAGQIKKLLKQTRSLQLTYSARERCSASFSQFASTMFSVLFTSVLLVKPHQAGTGTTTAWTEFKNDFFGWTDPSIPNLYSVQQAALPAQTTSKSRWLKPGALISTIYMLLRFDREFHDRYIQDTFRHDTFEPVSYQQAERLIRQHTDNHSSIVQFYSLSLSQDAYYRVYYREVIRTWDCVCGLGDLVVKSCCPGMRQSIAKEVETEFQLYQ